MQVEETKKKPVLKLPNPSALALKFQAYSFAPFCFSPNH
ncbi:uncharacterized protein METZ01_LOCUS191944 [marine metagenome]|uniref:Uncharacterized protein n=1 Tax=marine metagenome TaxID=408172 RepID=A0A382DKU0_9ZZZZ